MCNNILYDMGMAEANVLTQKWCQWWVEKDLEASTLPRYFSLIYFKKIGFKIWCLVALIWSFTPAGQGDLVYWNKGKCKIGKCMDGFLAGNWLVGMSGMEKTKATPSEPSGRQTFTCIQGRRANILLLSLTFWVVWYLCYRWSGGASFVIIRYIA